MPRIRHDSLFGVDLFSGLSEAALAALAAKARRRKLVMGEVVFAQGETDIALFIVMSGCIRLERRVTSEETVRLALVGEGETVDELSFASGAPTTMGAIAIEDTEVIELPASDFNAAAKRIHDLCPTLVRNLACRLQIANDKVSSLLALDASARLAREILRHIEPAQHEAHVDLNLGFSQEELARRIGTRRETVNRCLKELRQETVLVDLGRNRYRIDVPGLYRVAGYSVVRSIAK